MNRELIGQPSPLSPLNAAASRDSSGPIDPIERMMEEASRDIERADGVLDEIIASDFAGDENLGAITGEDCVFAVACAAAEKGKSFSISDLIEQLSAAPVDDVRLALSLVVLSELSRGGLGKGKPLGGDRFLEALGRDPTLAEVASGARAVVEADRQGLEAAGSAEPSERAAAEGASVEAAAEGALAEGATAEGALAEGALAEGSSASSGGEVESEVKR